MISKAIKSATAGALALLFVADAAFARTESKVERKHIELIYSAQVGNGQELNPGTYWLYVVKEKGTPEVLIYRDGKLVARTPAKLMEESQKIDRTEVIYNAKDSNPRVLTEICPAGWKEKIVFTDTGEGIKSGE